MRRKSSYQLLYFSAKFISGLEKAQRHRQSLRELRAPEAKKRGELSHKALLITFYSQIGA